MGLFDFFSKEKKETLDKGLSKTKEGVFSKLARIVAGKSQVDENILDDLEEVLITSDVGVETTLRIIDRIEKRVARDKYINTNELNSILREEITALLTENDVEDAGEFSVPEGKKPYVIMVVGVNGVGKTTTIGKLAYQFKKAGKKVYLGASDTFRAAAVEQLEIWSERVGVPIVKQQMGSDRDIVRIYRKAAVPSGVFDIVIDAAVGIGRTNVYQRSISGSLFRLAFLSFNTAQCLISSEIDVSLSVIQIHAILLSVASLCRHHSKRHC